MMCDKWETSVTSDGKHWDVCEEGGGDMIADVCDHPQAERRAKLMAAAPKLLAALISIEEHPNEFADIEDFETMLVRVVEKAREAIAEVEGR